MDPMDNNVSEIDLESKDPIWPVEGRPLRHAVRIIENWKLADHIFERIERPLTD